MFLFSGGWAANLFVRVSKTCKVSLVRVLKCRKDDRHVQADRVKKVLKFLSV